jgi:SpoIID/LytB domain protein
VRRLLVIAVLLLAPAPAQGAVITVRGHGWGHGVGMSQWGARGLADHGWGWRRILAHYYPGTSLSRAGRIRVRVLLVQGHTHVAVSAGAPFRIVDARGRSRLQRRRIVFRERKWHGLRPPLRIVPRTQPLALDGSAYRGVLVIRRGIDVVDELPLERYLRGVVPWEMPYRWSSDALRAQAVASRTYAVANLHPGSWYDLLPDTRDQMYGGIRAERPSTNAAVEATAHRILTWNGAPARTYYFSTSGGRTQSSHDAFNGPAIPYLRSVPDPYDGGPKHDWTYRFTTLQVAQRLHVPLPHSLSVELNGSGRVAAVVVRSPSAVRTFSGAAFEQALALPSTFFRLGTPPLRTQTHTAPRAGWVAVLETATERFRGSVSTSSFAGLRPGLWVRIKGPFASRAEAAAAAGARGYVKHVVRA